jgi:hypothetical protein
VCHQKIIFPKMKKMTNKLQKTSNQIKKTDDLLGVQANETKCLKISKP